MVDRFFDSIWEKMGTILQDRRTPGSSGPSGPTGGGAHHDLEMQRPPPSDTVLNFYDGEEEEDEDAERDHDDEDYHRLAVVAPARLVEMEEPLVPMSDYDFVKDYSAFVHAYYGRPPQYVTDLFCCMASILVEMTSGTTGVHTLHRYWWLPISHPLVVRLNTFREPNCGQVNAGFCGSFVIYADSIIVKWAHELCKLFRVELGVELQVRTSSSNDSANKEVVAEAPPPLPSPRKQQASPLMVRPEPKLPTAPPQSQEPPPPVIRMVPHTVSNKKGD